VLSGLLVRVLLMLLVRVLLMLLVLTLVRVLLSVPVLWLLLSGLLRLSRGARHRRASLVSHGDQESRDVLAVLARLLERRAGAM
jgi:hypothetical protein